MPLQSPRHALLVVVAVLTCFIVAGPRSLSAQDAVPQITPVPTPASQHAPEAFAKGLAMIQAAPSSFAEIDGAKLHYKSFGHGELAVVLIHGWNCDMTFWAGQMPAFDPATRVILIDLPGHGKSDKPQTDYTMAYFARAVDATLQHAGATNAALAGHSMGTPVARQFYRLYPAKTKAIVAVDGALHLEPAMATSMNMFADMMKGPQFDAMKVAMVDSMFSAATAHDVREHIRSIMMTATDDVAASAMRGMGDAAIWTADKIHVPLLVVQTDKGPFSSDAYEAKVRELSPTVDFNQLSGVGHFLMMEEPDEFNAIMMAFLKKNGVVAP